MLKVEVEGIYESDLGIGQKKYVEFNYSFKTSRLSTKGIDTHIEKRFIPMLVANEKGKNKNEKPIFSRVRNFNILNIEKIKDDEDCIIGKKLDSLNAWEIQDLACMFDLYDVPINGKRTFSEIKEKAISSYLKKVWNIDIDNPKEKEKLDCVVENAQGGYKYDFSNDEVLVQVPEGYFERIEKKEKRVKISDLMKKDEKEETKGGFFSTIKDYVSNIAQNLDDDIKNDDPSNLRII